VNYKYRVPSGLATHARSAYINGAKVITEEHEVNNMKTVLLLGLMTGLVLFLGEALGGRNGLYMAFGFAILMNFVSYWWSDKIVLFMNGASEVPEEQNPALHRMIAELAVSAGIPKPRVFHMDSPAPNAFATGRNPAHGVVAVTGGLLHLMNEHELRGVLAHEMAHIKNRDILIATVAATLAAALTVLARMAGWALMFGGGGRDRDEDRGGGAAALVLIILAPLIAMIVQLWISRTREYEADATGARVAGTPNGLANALLKLESASRRGQLDANPATAHLFIMSPISGGSLLRIFSTHPPIEERVRRLRSLTG
jgi:heat shock protein HtpX